MNRLDTSKMLAHKRGCGGLALLSETHSCVLHPGFSLYCSRVFPGMQDDEQGGNSHHARRHLSC
jgi:hypothetical protein